MATKDDTTTAADNRGKLLEQIRERLDFFFGDANFRRDKFLRAKADAHKERFVPISVLLTFNTLKELTTDVALVAEVAQGSEIVEVNDAKDALRRKSAAMPAAVDDTQTRVYASRFPLDSNWKEIREAFGACGKVVYVRLRRDRTTKSFVGSAFIDFKTVDEAKKAVAEPPMFRGEKLEKVELFSVWTAQKKSKHVKKRDRYEEDKQSEIDTNVFILRLEPVSETARYNDIKEALTSLAEEHATTNVRPAYVDLAGGSAFVRFDCTPKEAESFLEIVKTKTIEIDAKSVSFSSPSEDEVKEFWERRKRGRRSERPRRRGRDDAPRRRDAPTAESAAKKAKTPAPAEKSDDA